MLQSIDELLEEWERIKQLGCPTGDDVGDVSKYTQAKSRVDNVAQEIRNSRLTNNKEQEMRSVAKFIEIYFDFNKDFVYRTLKNDRKTQS